MNKLVLISISFFILLQAGVKTIVVSNYLINRSYISENLCENKNDIKLKCEGKCHLKKQLLKEDKKEQTPINKVKEKIEFQILQSSQNIHFGVLYNLIKPIVCPYLNLYIKTIPVSVFHPPD